MGLLIDSSVCIHAEREHLPPAGVIEELMRRWDDPELALSVMSAAELLHGTWRAETAARRSKRQEFVEAILGAIPVVPLTLPVARVFGEIDAELSRAGRRIPTSDLLIASTALSMGYELVTGNSRHFERVPGLQVHTLD